jgi:hypothetical protein
MSATLRSGKLELARSGMLLFRNERENRVKTPREDLLERLLVNIPKARTSLSAEIDRQIVAHTAPPIHALCENLQERLPRELRDIVYEHLLPPCDILIEATDFLPLDDPESSRPRLISFPHLLEHDYLDAITRKEYAEAWYRFCTFQFASTDLVGRFIHEDPWGMGLPVHQLARNFEIDIWHTDCMHESIYKRRSNIDQPQLLDCLLTVRSGARMVFPIDTMVRIAIWSGCEERKREFIELLSRFFVSARRLLAAGHHVVVEVDWSLVVNLTFDDLTQAAWRQKLEDHRRATAVQSLGESETW